MKKILLFSVLLSVALMLVLPDTGWAKNKYATKSWFKNKTTFVITAYGFPVKDETDILKRQYTAQIAAVTVAQYEMVTKLKNRKIKEQFISKTKFAKDQTCFLTYTVILEP
jgi:hypothetical protein